MWTWHETLRLTFYLSLRKDFELSISGPTWDAAVRIGLHFKRRIWPTHTTDSEHLIWQANLRMWEGGQREFRFTLQRCFRNTASRKLIALISLSLCVSFRPLSHSNQCLNSTDPIQDRMCPSTSDFRETWIMCGLWLCVFMKECTNLFNFLDVFQYLSTAV